MEEREKKNKNERILGIYTRLLDGKIIRKAEEASRYQVNERSIERDLEDIRDFLGKQTVEDGYVNSLIYNYKERGYQLEQISRMQFSNAEVLAISKILLDSRAFTKGEMNEMLDKLLSCCVPPQNRHLVNDLIANERFHYIEPQHKNIFIEKLWNLGQAIKESRMIEIAYTKLKGKELVQRRLQPVAIMFSEYYFYLVAFIEDIEREKAFENPNDAYPTIYRVDRIQELKVTDEHFKIPYANRFEEGEFRKRVQFMYGGKLQKVKFKYSGQSIEAVLDRLPTAKVLGEEDGVYTVSAEVFGKGIDMWLRSQGESVEILQ